MIELEVPCDTCATYDTDKKGHYLCAVPGYCPGLTKDSHTRQKLYRNERNKAMQHLCRKLHCKKVSVELADSSRSGTIAVDINHKVTLYDEHGDGQRLEPGDILSIKETE